MGSGDKGHLGYLPNLPGRAWLHLSDLPRWVGSDSHVLQQIRHPHPQHRRQPVYDAQGRVPLTPFDPTDIGDVQAALISYFLLG